VDQGAVCVSASIFGSMFRLITGPLMLPRRAAGSESGTAKAKRFLLIGRPPRLDGGQLAFGPMVLKALTFRSEEPDNGEMEGTDTGGRVEQRLLSLGCAVGPWCDVAHPLT